MTSHFIFILKLHIGCEIKRFSVYKIIFGPEKGIDDVNGVAEFGRIQLDCGRSSGDTHIGDQIIGNAACSYGGIENIPWSTAYL